MTNTRTTTKTNNYFRAMLTTLAMLAAMLVTSGAALAATTTFSNSSPMQIADSFFPDPGLADAYPSQINVQNLSGNTTDVNLKLNGYAHSFPDDVGVLLVGPQGQKALLMSDAGGGDQANSLADVNLTLDDEATISLPDSLPRLESMTSGTYKPTQGTVTPIGGDRQVPANFPTPAPAGPYAKNLSAFDGTNPNGTWSLFVIDDTQVDEGQFAGGWSLDITTDSPTPQPDTTAPKVTSTNPLPGATGVSPTANLTANFSEDIQGSTINTTTFKLFKKGSTTKVAAAVSYDATAHTAMLDSTNSLKIGATYKAVITTGANDLAGNSLDQDSSKVGNQAKTWTFTIART
jgi:subtilisin-like proprotein convertase family protein